jgi:hypothetical protein
MLRTNFDARDDSGRGAVERRSGIRGRVDFPVVIVSDGFRHQCRAVDLGPTGMVIELPRSLAAREAHLVDAYELLLDGVHLLRLLARPVWRNGTAQAVRFLGLGRTERGLLERHIRTSPISGMNDVDRLELAEDLDRGADHDAAAMRVA